MADADGLIGVEVAWSPGPREVRMVPLRLPAGSTLAQAVAASGLLEALAPAEREALAASVWGRIQPPEHVLRERDRVELTRPLTVDPKEARRLRYKQHTERLAARKAARPKAGVPGASGGG